MLPMTAGMKYGLTLPGPFSFRVIDCWYKPSSPPSPTPRNVPHFSFSSALGPLSSEKPASAQANFDAAMARCAKRPISFSFLRG